MKQIIIENEESGWFEFFALKKTRDSQSVNYNKQTTDVKRQKGRKWREFLSLSLSSVGGKTNEEMYVYKKGEKKLMASTGRGRQVDR